MTQTERTRTDENQTKRGTHQGSTRATLADVSHTNPHTGEAFGRTQAYGRGAVVAADGGADPERVATTEAVGDQIPDETREDGTVVEVERLEDVDHTPPKDAESANRVHERGREGHDDAA